jgi:hypothetical protein
VQMKEEVCTNHRSSIESRAPPLGGGTGCCLGEVWSQPLAGQCALELQWALGVGLRAVQLPGWQAFAHSRQGPGGRVCQVPIREFSLFRPNISAHLKEK